MPNILRFPSPGCSLPAGRVVGAPSADDAHESAIRLWERVMSGQRTSEEYQRIATHRSRTMSRLERDRPLPSR